METEIKTKEECLAFLHAMLEFLGPAKEQIENTQCVGFTIGETLAVANVMNALEDLESALEELDRVAQV